MTFKNGFFYDSVFDVRIGLQLLGRYQFLYGIFYRIGIGVVLELRNLNLKSRAVLVINILRQL